MIRETSRVAGLSRDGRRARYSLPKRMNYEPRLNITSHRLGRRFIGVSRVCENFSEIGLINFHFYVLSISYARTHGCTNVKVGAFARSCSLLLIATGIVVNNDEELAAWRQLKRQNFVSIVSSSRH